MPEKKKASEYKVGEKINLTPSDFSDSARALGIVDDLFAGCEEVVVELIRRED